ncbi:MAG: hypothetical protein ACHQ4J_06915 [Candidatus Binatia bacterium]
MVSIEQGSACVGDCDRNGAVTVGEVVKGVSIALGSTNAPRSTATVTGT